METARRVTDVTGNSKVRDDVRADDPSDPRPTTASEPAQRDRAAPGPTVPDDPPAHGPDGPSSRTIRALLEGLNEQLETTCRALGEMIEHLNGPA